MGPEELFTSASYLLQGPMHNRRLPRLKHRINISMSLSAHCLKVLAKAPTDAGGRRAYADDWRYAAKASGRTGAGTSVGTQQRGSQRPSAASTALVQAAAEADGAKR